MLRRWLRRGATGWRIDCANDLGFGVCAEITRAAREENAPDGITGEVMAYAEEWVADGRLDAVMNYYFRETVLALLRGEIAVAQAAYNLKRMARRYAPPALLRSWNMLGSHDTPRLASLLPDHAQRALAYTLAFTFPGIPHVYYGDEWGLADDPVSGPRAVMPWEGPAPDTAIAGWIRRLVDLRRASPALRHGRYEPLPQPGAPEILAFARVTDDPAETVLVIANAGKAPARGHFRQ